MKAVETIHTPEAGLTGDVNTVSAGLRFLLILHVFALAAGLIGLASSWLLIQVRMLSSRSSSGWNLALAAWGRKCLFGSICLYATGIVLGGIWAQLTWGRGWSWDPREAFALVTLGIATLWYGQLPALSLSSTEGSPDGQKPAFFAALSFWLIALMVVLAPVYATTSHTYGYSPMRLPNLLGLAMAANLVLVILVARFRAANDRQAV
jgi:ABC-type transport system involved in cytochrome c biogenesis permease subunit